VSDGARDEWREKQRAQRVRARRTAPARRASGQRPFAGGGGAGGTDGYVP
jgi:hypothetical protein